MKDKLIIIGASGHGKVVADIAIKMNKWKYIGFLDDDCSIKTSMGIENIGRVDHAHIHKNSADFLVAIGNNVIREKIQEQLEKQTFSLAKLIHPSAVIGSDVTIGDGTVIMPGVVINVSTKIGKGCIINTCSSLDHDDVIENFVHISPGSTLAGNVKVGARSWIGIGSVISNNVDVVNDCKLGAGAVVLKNITFSGTYVGVPAKKVY